MTGLTEETFSFLGDLQANNTKDWFENNRDRYTNAWLVPAQDLVAELAPALTTGTPRLEAIPKLNKSIRRIHRDTRFSKDKTPYSPRLHLIFWAGEHPNRAPGMHIVVHPDGLGYGAGHWAMTPAQLTRFRKALTQPTPLAELQTALQTAQAVGSHLDAETLKRLPQGAPKDTPVPTLFKRKGLVIRTPHLGCSPAECIGPDGVARIRTLIAAHLPVIAWLTKHVMD